MVKDDDMAIALFEKLSEKGNLKAVTSLGFIYSNADTPKNDYTKAKKLFEKAASQNHGYSQYYLSPIYSNGYGVKKDPIVGEKWLTKVCENRNPLSCIMLELLRKSSKKVE